MFAVASTVTAVLSLDATVVLLTPVVFATVAQLRLRSKPHVYACTHLANSASLLLPVSNLTNLLAFSASGLSFARFGATMVLPWLAVIAVKWLVLRRFFSTDLVGRAEAVTSTRQPVPVFACIVVALTLLGFFVTSVLHVAPAFAALGGAVTLAVPALVSRRATVRDVGLALEVPFLAFVLALGFIVKAVSVHGLGTLVTHLVPGGTSLGALLLIAAVAAVLANLINNLPAVLLLRRGVRCRSRSGARGAHRCQHRAQSDLRRLARHPALAPRPPATRRGAAPLGVHAPGCPDVPPALVAATVALWVSLRLVG